VAGARRRDGPPRVLFGDLIGNVYAVDAISENLIWKAHVRGASCSATLTSAPVAAMSPLYFGLPRSGRVPGNTIAAPFRGSVVAYESGSYAYVHSYLLPKAEFSKETSHVRKAVRVPRHRSLERAGHR